MLAVEVGIVLAIELGFVLALKNLSTSYILLRRTKLFY